MYKAGFVGSLSRAHCATMHPDLDVRALCEIREEQLLHSSRVINYLKKQLRAVKGTDPATTYTDYDEMLDKEDLDMVFIATPDRLHASMAVAALESGRHVWVEKPMCLNLDEVDQMVSAVRKSGLKLVVNQSVRTTNTMHHVIDLRDKGKLGTPYYVKANYIHSQDPRVDGEKPNNINQSCPLFPFGSHPIDLILGIMDDEPEEVYTIGAKMRTTDAYPFPDAMSVSIRFPENRIGNSLTTSAARRRGGFEFELYGTEMDVVLHSNIYGDPVRIPDLDFEAIPVGMRFYTSRDEYEDINFFDYPSGHRTSFFRMYENLIHAVKHDVKNPTTADVIDGARCIATAVAAEESARTGKAVAVQSWERLRYTGTAPRMEIKDYMQGWMRWVYLSRETQRAVALGEIE